MPTVYSTNDWRALRWKVLRRDRFRCQFCAVEQETHLQATGSGLQAHHIIPRTHGGEDAQENLITVCMHCHNVLEGTHAQGMKQLRERYQADGDSLPEAVDVGDLNRSIKIQIGQRLRKRDVKVENIAHALDMSTAWVSKYCSV